MSDRWTRRQYAIVRALLGAYLFVHFVQLLGWAAEVFSSEGCLPAGSASPLLGLFPNVLALADGPVMVTGLVLAGALASLALAAGIRDRFAAVLVWYVWACLFGRNPLIANPSLPYVGWMLLAHAAMPRGRSPRPIIVGAWIVMAAGYSYSGWMKLDSPSWIDGTAVARVLENPLARPGLARDLMRALPGWLLALFTWSALALELAFLPLSSFRATRQLAWTAMLCMHLGLIALIDFADLSIAMVLVHLFTFDPAWIPGREPEGDEVVFYDGTCGVCHGFARFVLEEDRGARPLVLGALQGGYFASVIPAEVRAGLPDSVVVLAHDGRLLVRSAAILHVLERLGGSWRVLAAAARIVPRPLADRAYDAVAAVRDRLARRPPAACPLMPAAMRARFVD